MASPDVVMEDGDQSLKEKTADDQTATNLEDRGEIANLPPDPDANLTAEERERIVSLYVALPPTPSRPAKPR